MSDIDARVEAGVGHLVLNRPQALNALTPGMIDELARRLDEWRDDESVTSIELSAAGDRAFCAGADIKTVRRLILDDPDAARAFFDAEYALDAQLARYPKPVVARMRGIVMGGGLGLTAHGRDRRADASTRVAMPETIIGLHPDVGLLYELARAPRETGTYLALTGSIVDAASARYAGLVDVVEGEAGGSPFLEQEASWIEDCFAGDDAVAIARALEAHPDERARTAGQTLRQRSPLAVTVTLEAIRRAAHLGSVEEVLAQDRVLVDTLIDDPDEFVEGVRAQVIDKDRAPRWRHARLEDVSRGEVLACFGE